MNIEDRDRLLRVEIGIDNISKLLGDYIKKPCIERGCELHDDVQSLKESQKRLQKGAWFFFTAILSAIIALIFK